MLFLPKGSQNVSKLLIFNFNDFEQNGFNSAETFMPIISKCEFSQPDGTGVNVSQKRKVIFI